MNKILIGIGACVALVLSGCSPAPDKCASASNPTECQAWGNAGGSIDDYLIGGMAGYVLATVMQGGQRHTIIQQNPSYHGPVRTLRTPIPSRSNQLMRLKQQNAYLKGQNSILRSNQSVSKPLATKTPSSSYRPSTPSFRSNYSGSSFRSSGSSFRSSGFSSRGR